MLGLRLQNMSEIILTDRQTDRQTDSQTDGTVVLTSLE